MYAIRSYYEDLAERIVARDLDAVVEEPSCVDGLRRGRGAAAHRNAGEGLLDAHGLAAGRAAVPRHHDDAIVEAAHLEDLREVLVDVVLSYNFV